MVVFSTNAHRHRFAALSIFCAAALSLGACGTAPAKLRIGQSAPPFTLPDTDGKPVTLAELIAVGPVILAFFPKAFTSG